MRDRTVIFWWREQDFRSSVSSFCMRPICGRRARIYQCLSRTPTMINDRSSRTDMGRSCRMTKPTSRRCSPRTTNGCILKRAMTTKICERRRCGPDITFTSARRSHLWRLRCLELFSAVRTPLFPAIKSRLRGSASIFPPRRNRSPIPLTELVYSPRDWFHAGFALQHTRACHAPVEPGGSFGIVHGRWDFTTYVFNVGTGRAERGAGFGV